MNICNLKTKYLLIRWNNFHLYFPNLKLNIKPPKKVTELEILTFLVFWHFCTHVFNFSHLVNLHRQNQTYDVVKHEWTSVSVNENITYDACMICLNVWVANLNFHWSTEISCMKHTTFKSVSIVFAFLVLSISLTCRSGVRYLYHTPHININSKPINSFLIICINDSSLSRTVLVTR